MIRVKISISLLFSPTNKIKIQSDMKQLEIMIRTETTPNGTEGIKRRI